MAISSLGVGSGVLTSDLVDKLVAAERQPTQKRLDFNQQRSEALISAYGKLRSAVTELRLPMRQLSAPDNLKAFSGSSSNEGVAVTVDSNKASTGSFSVQVDSLAKAQSLASSTFADKDSTSVGTGTLTVTVGDEIKTLTIDGSNNTLQGLASEINDAGIGVSAGVVDTGSGFRLVVSSTDTGTANEVSVSVSDDDGDDTDAAGLSQFVFDGTTSNLTETVAAQDAVVQINGIEITRSNNIIENAVEGVTFDLKEAGITSEVKVSQDLGRVADRVKGFVDKFNELQATIKELSGFNAETGQGSLLTGDSTVRNIQSQLRGILTRVVPGLEGASVRSLADVGITTNFETGGLEFDSAKFKDQLAKNPDDVTALFAEQGRATDSQVGFVRSGLDTEPGTYAINVTQAATQGAVTGDSALADGVIIDASNDQLTIQVNGDSSAALTLTAGTYTTAQDLVTEIQAQLNANTALKDAGAAVQVGLDGAGKLTFTSSSFGSESNASITSVEDGAALGLSTKTGTAGLDVAGTIDGRAAKGDGQTLFLEGGVGGAAGLQVRVGGTETGDRGSITFIEGVAEQTVDLVTSIVSGDGTINARTDGLQSELNQIQESRVKLEERIVSFRQRLVDQFSSADSLISQLNSTRDYITQQLAALAPRRNSNS